MNKYADTIPTAESGDVLTRGVRPFAVPFKGDSVTADLR